ncbi:peroxisomal membrane protein PEX31 [Metarhizium rileyi]|uniref:Peroxisomal membrane protein PEX31 n=1 Tax=Metarhizium rileyi (strain RCEF 4871) TaxID=1649241 RepID=A0A167JQY2_METRR|nr:peroxisomal membrane protein PEX31 [Metarhizium rileyi RCEF 4871]TWU76038.1 hypothetical protein ED733_007290 [Metarhizium rileyi]
MDDALPSPSPSPVGRSSRLQDEEVDLLTPLLQSRRPSRQYGPISPPSSDSLIRTRSCPPRPEALPAFANPPWPSRASRADVQAPTSPEFWTAPRGQAGLSTPRTPSIQVHYESAGGQVRETTLSMASEDTVRGLPLTPFPPWMSNSDRECRASCEGRYESSKSEAGGCRCDGLGGMRKGFVHAMVLAVQFIALMGVSCVWVGVAVREAGSDAELFWLWVYVQPALGMLGLFTMAMILVYEVIDLSDTVFLGAQVVMLVVTSTTGFCMAWWAFEQGSRVVIGTAVGTAAMMLGVGMFGFVRAALIWWLEES